MGERASCWCAVKVAQHFSTVVKGTNYVVSPLAKTPHSRVLQGLRISFCGLDGLARLFEKSA